MLDRQIMIGGQNDFLLFCKRNTCRSAAILGMLSKSDFDKDNRVFVLGDDVDFPSFAPIVPCAKGEPVADQKVCSSIFGQ